VAVNISIRKKIIARMIQKYTISINKKKRNYFVEPNIFDTPARISLSRIYLVF
jgi:hypothetical protein